MKLYLKAISIVFLFLFLTQSAIAQVTFYNLNTIQKIEINFSQPNWDYELDTAKAGAEEYIAAVSVTINGMQYDSAGVKYKGNSSYDATYKKNPIHIALDEFKNQSYQGLTDIKLGNGYADPSLIREVLSYQILGHYMDCPRSNFAQLYINGVYQGLYSNDESISKSFCTEHFYSSKNTFIKCNPVITPSPTTKSNLKYKASSDSSVYFNYYDIKSNSGWNDLVALCDSVTNHAGNISSVLDMDRVIWMLAFNNVVVNLDSYTGVFAQNYYLYKDHTQHYNPIIWDLNMSLGGFPFVGGGATGTGSLTVANMQQLSPAIHATDQYWPLINAVMSNATYKRMYIAHMRTILSEMFANNTYQTMALQLQTLIDTAVVSDTNNFFSYTQFQNGMTSNYPVGSYTVPGISNLMMARVAYLQSTAEFTAMPPAIIVLPLANPSPVFDSSVFISAMVTNTNPNAVYLGYRYKKSEHFERVLMYDDGVHGDGASGDNIYGASIVLNSLDVQYYIYAENSSAGIFSPERAEHEFYSITPSIAQAQNNAIVINEFLANNANNITNESGKHKDWIEIYNKTNTALGLQNIYLSDDSLNFSKWNFPAEAFISAHGYLLAWADDKNETLLDYHTNFNLSNLGEPIILSDSSGTLLDSVQYSIQVADQGFARCPDGAGVFQATAILTPQAVNICSALGISQPEKSTDDILIYPNPASDKIIILSNGIKQIQIFNTMGQVVYEKQFSSIINATIDLSSFNQGIYFVRVNHVTVKKLIVSKANSF